MRISLLALWAALAAIVLAIAPARAQSSFTINSLPAPTLTPQASANLADEIWSWQPANAAGHRDVKITTQQLLNALALLPGATLDPNGTMLIVPSGGASPPVQIPLQKLAGSGLTMTPAGLSVTNPMAGYVGPTVANYGALRGLAPTALSGAPFVCTLGYTWPGDGGQGCYSWYAGDTTAPNGVTIVSSGVPGTVGNWYLAVGPRGIDVRQAGAVSSTTLDSSAAFIAAAAATDANGNLYNLYVPPLPFHLANCVTLGSGSQSQRIQGDGWASILYVSSDLNPACAGVLIPANNRFVNQQVSIKDLQVLAQPPHDIVTTATAAEAQGSCTLQVASAVGLAVGDFAYDATAPAALPLQVNSAVAPQITAISGATLTISPCVVSPGVAGNDALHFGPPRAAYQTLSAGCNPTAPAPVGCKYPWLIYNNGGWALNIDNVLLNGGWDCWYNRGSTFDVGTLYEACLDQGANLDASSNFPRIDYLQFYAFSLSTFSSSIVNGAGGSVDTTLDVYYDGGTTAANLGNIESVQIGALHDFVGKVNLLSDWNGGHIGYLALDTAGANMVVSGGAYNATQIDAMYSSAGSAGPANPGPASIVFNPGGGAASMFTINSVNATVAAPSYPFLLVESGDLTIDSGTIWDGISTTTPVISQTGGALRLGPAVRLTASGGTNAAQPFIACTGGILQMHASFDSARSNGQPGLTMATACDNAESVVSDVGWNGWSFAAPGLLGLYQPAPVVRWTAPGSYNVTPNTGYTALELRGCGWGGPGGSGAVAASGQAASGAGSGAPGLCTSRVVPMSQIVAQGGVLQAVIGAAPTTPAAVTGTSSAGTAGNTGTAGGLSGFGDGVALLNLYAGGPGQGGQLAASSSGGGTASYGAAGATPGGGNGNTDGGIPGGTGTPGTVGGDPVGASGSGSTASGQAFSAATPLCFFCGSPGGSGGGVSAGGAGNNGGNGSRTASNCCAIGNGGTSSSPNGTSPSNQIANDVPGGGAGGGWGGVAATGGNGGAGSWGDGGGGGGSVQCASGTCTSGAGGAPGAAFVEVRPIR